MSTSMIIFGAGLSGLIAARMLADRHPVVYERQASLPNNHQALLRFRSSIVGDATNVPFKKVSVNKYILRGGPTANPISDAVAYSLKVTGKIHNRSIIDTRPVERFIAPPDFIKRLAATAEIHYGMDFLEWSPALVRPHGPLISTLPMPVMMDMFDWKDKPEFKQYAGWTIRAEVRPDLECQVNATVYSPRPQDAWYRASLTGPALIVEGVGNGPSTTEEAMQSLRTACVAFGLETASLEHWNVTEAKYQKISDLTSEERESAKRFIMFLSEKHQIYSLGRFAVWRPKLLLDDLVNDVRVIARMIEGQSQYHHKLES